MIWFLSVPVFAWFAGIDLLASGFPGFEPHQRMFLEWCFMVFTWTFLTGLFTLIPLGIACWIGSLPPRRSIKDRDYPLVALRERDGVSGTFFLGSGAIQDKQYYFWYRKGPGGEVQGGKTYREPGVRIYQDSANPVMRIWVCEYTWKHTDLWLWIVGIDMRSAIYYCPDFHIPAGSILEGYSL